MDIKITIGADARLLETINRLTEAISGSNRVQGTLQEIPDAVLKANASQNAMSLSGQGLELKKEILRDETTAAATADEAFEEKHAMHAGEQLSPRIVDATEPPIREPKDVKDYDRQDNEDDQKIYTEAELKELELSEIMPILTALGVDPAQTPGMNTNKKLRTLVLQAQEQGGGQTIKERIHEREQAQEQISPLVISDESEEPAKDAGEVQEVSNESFRAQIARLNDLDKRQSILDLFAKYKVSKQSQLEGEDRWNCYNELCKIK